MTPVSAPHSSDISRMTRNCEPVVSGSTNAAPLHGWIARPVMPSDEKHNPLTARYRLLEAAVDRGPGGVKIHAMKI
jgi:hypothetical protein